MEVSPHLLLGSHAQGISLVFFLRTVLPHSPEDHLPENHLTPGLVNEHNWRWSWALHLYSAPQTILENIPV